MRDNFPKAVRVALAQRVANRCSNPQCGAVTSGPQNDVRKAVDVGVAAHITGASKSGPRYNEALSDLDRKGIENGIWLCQTCAKLIDNDVSRFTESVLRNWKHLAEDNTRSRVGKTALDQIGEPIRVVLKGLVGVQGPREFSMLAIEIQNHGVRPVFLDRVSIELDGNEQFIWLVDPITGEPQSRCMLQPANSIDYHFDPREMIRQRIPLTRAKDVVVRDAIGNVYRANADGLPSFLESIASFPPKF